jgi:ABC-type nitrate/sulfonate/bicarbonate transport system permease component
MDSAVSFDRRFCFAGTWHLAQNGFHPSFFPAPSKIFLTLVLSAMDGKLAGHLGSTL